MDIKVHARLIQRLLKEFEKKTITRHRVAEILSENTVLFLVLFCIQLKVCHSVESQNEPFNCNRFMDYVIRDWSCKPDGLFQMPDGIKADGIVTRDELLTEIGAHCSNNTVKANYLDCMATLAVECPAQYFDVIDSIRDKVNMFCDGESVSPWLNSVVKDGYSFNLTCSEVSSQAMSDCVKTLNINVETIGSNTSFITASLIVPPIISDMFQCMKTKLALIPDPKHECGSSWQDILLQFWLKMSAVGSVFVTLSTDDRQELLATRTGSFAENLK